MSPNYYVDFQTDCKLISNFRDTESRELCLVTEFMKFQDVSHTT